MATMTGVCFRIWWKADAISELILEVLASIQYCVEHTINYSRRHVKPCKKMVKKEDKWQKREYIFFGFCE